MTRYRWRTPTRRGRWLPTSKEAREAAARAGEAEKHGEVVFLFPLTEIETEER
jgi:hypothetical protein